MEVLLLKLLLAHFVADFLLQPLSWVNDKKEKAFRSGKLLLHVLVHGLLYSLVLAFQTKYWLGLIILMVSHYLIDGLKSLAGKKLADNDHFLINSRSLFLLDQLLHVAVIAAVVNIYHPDFWQRVAFPQEQFLLLLLTMLLLTRVSSIVVSVLISRWTPDSPEDGTSDSLARAGSYIGMLERLFVFVFVVMGHWQGLGFLLAAKSVFRFGDLKEAHDRKLTEYMLIGTLLSFGLSILISLGYRYILTLI